jgi:hypothetical protein
MQQTDEIWFPNKFVIKIMYKQDGLDVKAAQEHKKRTLNNHYIYLNDANKFISIFSQSFLNAKFVLIALYCFSKAL